MSPDPIADPWRRYQRLPVKAGWSYPVGQREIGDALTAARVEVDELILFFDSSPERRRANGEGRVSLFAAEWSGRRSELWVYAVPSSLRSTARQLMLGPALAAATRWLGQLPARGNAWQATRHRFEGSAIDGVFRTAERDAYWPPDTSDIR